MPWTYISEIHTPHTNTASWAVARDQANDTDGDTAILILSMGAPATVTPTGNNANGMKELFPPVNTDGRVRIFVFRYIPGATLDPNFTFTLGSPQSGHCCMILARGGEPVLDVGEDLTVTGTTTPAISITPIRSDDLSILVINTSSAPRTFTPPTNWTERVDSYVGTIPGTGVATRVLTSNAAINSLAYGMDAVANVRYFHVLLSLVPVNTTVTLGLVLNLAPGGFANRVRPASDISAGTWTTAPLFNKLDEVTQDDADFIQSATQPVNDTAEVKLDPMAPLGGTASDHSLKVAYSKDAAGGETIGLVASLRRGASEELDTVTLADIAPGWALSTRTVNFSGNRDDLRVRLVANATNGGNIATGDQTIGGTSEALAADTKRFWKFTTPANWPGTVDSIAAYLDRSGTGSGYDVQAGIYTDNAGVPNALVGDSSILLASNIARNAAAWYSVNYGTKPTLAASTTYWIGVQFAKAGVTFYNAGAANQQASNADVFVGGLADPFGGTITNQSRQGSCYILSVVIPVRRACVSWVELAETTSATHTASTTLGLVLGLGPVTSIEVGVAQTTLALALALGPVTSIEVGVASATLSLALNLSATPQATRLASASLGLALNLAPVAVAVGVTQTTLGLTLALTPTAIVAQPAQTTLALALVLAPVALSVQQATTSLNLNLALSAISGGVSAETTLALVLTLSPVAAAVHLGTATLGLALVLSPTAVRITPASVTLSLALALTATAVYAPATQAPLALTLNLLPSAIATIAAQTILSLNLLLSPEAVISLITELLSFTSRFGSGRSGAVQTPDQEPEQVPGFGGGVVHLR